MSSVETVRGPVDARGLGVTLMHEHIFVRDQELEENHPDALWDEEAMVARARKGLTELSTLGVGCLVDVTALGLGRSIPRIQRVAEGLDINIVVATGAYYLRELPTYLAINGPGCANDVPEPFDRMFLADIEEGIAGTGVKAAVIKVSTDAGAMSPMSERMLRAAARVHLQTNVPITTHSDAATHGGRAQQALFVAEGVDLERVVIGHCGDTTELDYLKELMDNGSYIGMDRFGFDSILSQEKRIRTVVTLCQQGYAERMTLSHDVGYFGFGIEPSVIAKLEGRNFEIEHTLIPTTILPELRRRGVTDAQIQQMMVANPARVLSRTV